MPTIVYIGGFEMPDKNAAAHRVLSNGKMLRDLGYDVVFIDVMTDNDCYTEIVNTKRTIQGFDCYSMLYPTSNKDWLRYLSDIEDFKTVAQQYKDVEFVICYNYPSFSFLKLKSYCKANHIKLVSDCTEWYVPTQESLMYSLLKGFDSSLRMRFIQKHLDGLIVISNYLKNYYKKCGNVIFLPPLVDVHEEKWHHQEQTASDDKIRLVYAGSPGKTKDRINIILEYLAGLQDVTDYVLYIVGITQEQFLEYYPEHEPVLNNLGDKAQFLGRLPHLETLDYLKNSDFSIFIRKHSLVIEAGFPTKFVESISCGVPVITTQTSDLKDFLVEGKNGYFLNVEDEKETQNKLKKILTMDKSEISALKQYCAENNMFDYHKYLNDMQHFIENLKT